jgi:hypothetical protein
MAMNETIKACLDDEARLLLLNRVISPLSTLIFDPTKPYEEISFEDWYLKLTREELLSNANKEILMWADELKLIEIKDYFRSAAQKMYLHKKQQHKAHVELLLAKKAGK